MTATNPLSRDPGIGSSPVPGGEDGALSDLAFRVRDVWRLLKGERGEIRPDGDWMRDVDRVTRREWTGYHRRVHLETKTPLGGGWRVWMYTLDGSVQYPVRNRRVVPNGDGPLIRENYLEIHSAPEPGHVPTYPRREAFRVAELFMTGYSMVYGSDALERNGWGPDDTDE